MFRKSIYTLTLLLMALILVACGASSQETSATDAGDPAMREIPAELKLMMGTVLLDDSDHAVDAEQAAELLPLYKVLNTLAGSETAAQSEVDAVIASIQDAMTPEQTAAIDALDLTMADMGEVFQILGIETNFGGGFGQLSEEQQATMEAGRASGEFPQGGPGGGPGLGMGPGGGMGAGGGEFGGDSGITPEMRETAIAERSSGTGRGFGINTQLLEAIIAFLEAK